MAHKTLIDKEVTLTTDNVPQDYAAKLCFLVKGGHLVDVFVTEKHLEQLVNQIQEFQQRKTTT
jgi:hypothetical protein